MKRTSEIVYSGGGDAGPMWFPSASWDGLQKVADENGVGQLYNYAVSELTLIYRHYLLNGAMTFIGNIGGEDVEVITFFPAQSIVDRGLRYEVCPWTFNRFANPGQEAEVVFLALKDQNPLPERFAGFITSEAEIDYIAQALEGTSEL